MNKDRLLKLADFLRRRFPDKLWDFNQIISLGNKDPHEAYISGGGCGTVGCALGFAPIIFPDDLRWVRDCMYDNRMGVVLKNDERESVESVFDATLHTARTFFDLSSLDVKYLFFPEHYNWNGRNTSRFEVAARIEAFVKNKGRMI